MTDDILDRVERALDGVTPGPWALEIVDGFPVAHQHYHYDSADEWYDVDGPSGGWLAHCQDITDAAFVATSRSLVVELADALRAARTENEDLRAELTFARDGITVRPMTETESNLMTQVLDLRRENARLKAAAKEKP